MTMSTEDPVVLHSWIIEDESTLSGWAEDFSQHIAPPGIFLLDGPMGSGKTTLMRNLMQALNGEKASSPTFSLVNEYRYRDGMVYHFDLYRLDNVEELEEIGFEEYLGYGEICFVEWPQLGVNFYDNDQTSTIRIEILPDNRRRIQWFKGIVL